MDVHAVSTTLYQQLTRHGAQPANVTVLLEGPGPLEAIFLTPTESGACVLGMRPSPSHAAAAHTDHAVLRLGFHTRHRPGSLFALRDGAGALRCCSRLPPGEMTAAGLADVLQAMRDALEGNPSAPAWPSSQGDFDHADPATVCDLDFHEIHALDARAASRIRETALRLNFIALFDGGPPIRESDTGRLNIRDACASRQPHDI